MTRFEREHGGSIPSGAANLYMSVKGVILAKLQRVIISYKSKKLVIKRSVHQTPTTIFIGV